MATRQHGVVTVSQLREAGLCPSAISKRARAGRLHRLHRGVYAVGHISPSRERRWLAAVLALGPEAVLSHRSGAVLWGWLPDARGPVDVSIPGRGGRTSRSGIRIHRPRALIAAETTVERGIPVTSPGRTLADLRRAVPSRELRRAVRRAEVLGLEVGPYPYADRTRSELESQFLRLCRNERLPEPEVNARIGRMTVDFLWKPRRFIVETDGFRFHRGREAFEQDRARDLRLRSLGYEVLRLSHRQVFEEPAKVARVIRAALGRFPAPGEQ